MSFFNKKEDVIEIQLTQHGKHLLSKGKFKPTHYTFFDDDILYDAQYAGATGVNKEEQNDAQVRIEETPYLKTQYVFSSRERAVGRLTTLLTNADTSDNPTEVGKTQDTIEKHYSLGSSLGNSSLGSDKLPSWSVTFLKGEIGEKYSHISGAKQNVKIPQLIAEPVSYTTEAKLNTYQLTREQIDESLEGSLETFADVYPDETYLTIDRDYLLLDVNELNVDFDNDNFDVEVFRVEDEGLELKRYSSLKLDGIEDYATIAYDAKLVLTGEFTIDFWFKMEDSGARISPLFEAPINNLTGNSHEALMRLVYIHPLSPDDALYEYATHFYFALEDHANGALFKPPANTVKIGKWHHMVIARDNSDIITMTLDDINIPTPDGTSFTSGTTTGIHPGRNLNLGTWHYGDESKDFYFKGSIDNFKITTTTNYVETTQLLLEFNGPHGTADIVDSSDNDITCEAKGDAHLHSHDFEYLIPLSFLKKPTKIKDGILLDEPEGGWNSEETDPRDDDPTYVGYWFDVLCDHEIPEPILCANLPKSETRGGIFSQDTLNCPDIVKTTPAKSSAVDTDPNEEECK